MKLFGKDLDSEVAVVAEIGVNHEGDLETALRLIRLAAEAGADAVKFQSYTPERFVSAADPERLARVRKFALDDAAHLRLAGEAERSGIPFFSTPVTEDKVAMLAELCPAIKIASADLTFEPVIRAAARTGKSMIVSTGLGTVEEIDATVGWIREEIRGDDLAERLVLLHCVTAYPTPVEEANVRSVPFLARRYRVPVGYSNHVLGTQACLAAVALGAAVIEAHFTDRKTGRAFRDHALSLEPEDLAALVRDVAAVKASLGEEDKVPQPSEIPVREAVRKGVVAARDLPAGQVLGRDDLMYARPATEFPASALPTLIGRRLRNGVRLGEVIARGNLAEA